MRAELAAEEREDAAMRSKYGGRWEVVASDAMTQEAQAELPLPLPLHLSLILPLRLPLTLTPNPTPSPTPSPGGAARLRVAASTRRQRQPPGCGELRGESRRDLASRAHAGGAPRARAALRS